ncbi:MAG: glycosyltransferase family 39 protein [Anaerolineae bacterium]|nr:glycosyltransferase family 39 protein [Anaerolineae bacterium]
MYRSRFTPYALALILVVGALLRVVGLGEQPPGLYHDEAYYGLDALRVLAGERPVFFEANNGREPLFIYLVAASIGVLGRTPVAIRLVAALVGTLILLATFWLGRALFSERVGLLAAAVTALTVWTVNLSRVGFRAVTMPLVLALCLWQAAEAVRTGRTRHWVAAGALYGLLFYTYLAARFTPVALAALAVVLWLGQRGQAGWDRDIGRSARGVALAALVAFVVAAPLLVYLAAHLDETVGRSGQVSILNPAINHGDPWGLLARQAIRTLGMFNWRADFIPRHNVPLRPVFDPALGLAFLIGLIVAARRWRQPAYALVLVWTGVMLLPTILAEDAPHFLRAAGSLPVALLLPALGLEAVWTWLASRGRAGVGRLAVATVLVLALVSTIHDYFLVHTRSDAAYYEFETGATQAALEINRFLGAGWQGGWTEPHTERPEGYRAYLAERLWDNWANIRFLTTPSGVRTLTPDRRLSGDHVLLVLWPFEDNHAALAQLPTPSLIEARGGASEQGDLEPAPRQLYYTVRSTPELPPARLSANFGPTELVDAEWHQVGHTVQVRLVWRSMGPLPPNLSAFVHAVGPNGLLAQADGPPGGLYPGAGWRPGDVIAEERHLDLPPNTSLTEIRIGLYDVASQNRLRLPDGSDAVIIQGP